MHIIHNHNTPLMSQSQVNTHIHICCAHTKLLCKEPALLSGNNSFFLHVTLVPNQDNLCIVPGVGLDLSSPKERQREDCVNDILLCWQDPAKLEDVVSLQEFATPKLLTMNSAEDRWMPAPVGCHRC